VLWHAGVAIPRKHAHLLQRLYSLAFSFGTFAYAKDQASLLLDGLLKEYPAPCSDELFGFISIRNSETALLAQLYYDPKIKKFPCIFMQ
jgi:hypothetical protein